MSSNDRTASDFPTHEALSEALEEKDDDGNKDWELKGSDAATSVPQTKEGEVQRLLTLLSYNILDTPSEPEFDTITQDACRAFDVPIALVSLVDLGRQWFKSAAGLPVSQTPRLCGGVCSFCAHVVQRSQESGCMVVADATKDPRFCNHPLVTGAPEIRFYAGAPLISPEGPTLGALCIIDFKPHPNGMSDKEEALLEAMASEVVYSMIARAGH